jgi:ABC-type phosphate/phosphonate transport system ATPase subunit
VVALIKGKVVYDGPSQNVTRGLLAEVYSGDPDLDLVEMEKETGTGMAA